MSCGTPRLVVDLRALLALTVLLVCGTAAWWLRDPRSFLPLDALILLLHFGILPAVARRRGDELDRSLLLALQQGKPALMRRELRRSWLVRLYAPLWYVRGKEALVCQEEGRFARAEQLYGEALPLAPEPEQTTFLANLALVEDRQGKHEQAARTRQRLARLRPDLAEALDRPPAGEEDDDAPGRAE